MKVIDHKQGEYTLLDLTTNKEKTISLHTNEIVCFQSIANKSYGCVYLEFFIEIILQHTGDSEKLSTLQFKVKARL
jgi:hypothetical protein